MDRVRKFLVLSASEKLLLVVAGVLFSVFSVTLRVGSLEASEVFARRLARLGLSRWSVEKAEWAFSVIESCRLESGGCLPAAMVGLAIIDDLPELRIGVRAGEATIEAHAWLECTDGKLLYMGDDPTEFRRLDEK